MGFRPEVTSCAFIPTARWRRTSLVLWASWDNTNYHPEVFGCDGIEKCSMPSCAGRGLARIRVGQPRPGMVSQRARMWRRTTA